MFSKDSISLCGSLETQGGGHQGILGAVCNGIKLVAKPFKQKEFDFYNNIVDYPLNDCIPKFFGTKISNGNKYLLIEDLTQNIKSPCIADIKMGTRTFEIDSPIMKQLKQLSNMYGTTSQTDAIRIIDITIRKNHCIIDRCTKPTGKMYNTNKMKEAIREYLKTDQLHEDYISSIDQIIKKYRKTKIILPGLRLYSASALFIYDGDNLDIPITCKLIDFAHAYLDIEKEGGSNDDSAYDDNMDLALNNLLKI